MIVQGLTSDGLSKPLLVDAYGNVIISGADDSGTSRQLKTDGSGRLMTVSMGMIEGSYHSNPIIFGASGQKIDNVTNNSIPAGTSNQPGATVPSGEVWVLTNISILTSAAIAAGYINVSIAGTGGSANLFRQNNPAASILYSIQGYWVLFPGAYINYLIVGGVAAAIFVGSATGFRMDIDL